MVWPGITDFSEAVQNPRLCFTGTEFEGGTVSVNQRGTPLVFSGAFACVYPVSVGGQTFAVRCFTREVKDQQDRYNELSDYLMNVLPPSFVQFEFVERGINLRGSWYPIVKMEWVTGESLSSFVGARVNDPATLRRAAAQWRGGPTASLRGLGIAHNDLQHGNVMVQADGRIRLVDYDGMFLPRFRGERSPELGHKNFQHPLRTTDDYDAYVDNFPSVVVYLSLIALASDPSLWDTFYNDDNLIFTRTDYGDPGKSALFDRLKKSSDQSVSRLAERLEEYCALPVEKVPNLEEFLRGIPLTATPPPTAAPSTPQPAAPPSPTQGVSSQGYRQMLRGQGTTRPQTQTQTAPPARRPVSPPRATAQSTQARPAQPIAPLAPLAPPKPVGKQVRQTLLGIILMVTAVTLGLGGLLAWLLFPEGWYLS